MKNLALGFSSLLAVIAVVLTVRRIALLRGRRDAEAVRERMEQIGIASAVLIVPTQVLLPGRVEEWLVTGLVILFAGVGISLLLLAKRVR